MIRDIDILSFVNALKGGGGCFKTLSAIELILDKRGRPFLYGGKNSGLFKVLKDGKPYALKCYCSISDVNIEALEMAYTHFKENPSPLVVVPQIFRDELHIRDRYYHERDCTVALYDWVEGESLDSLIYSLLTNQESEKLSHLITDFLTFAIDLLRSDFAHGDIKPENILFRESSFVLVDLDAIFHPKLARYRSAEIGTRGFRHYTRSEITHNSSLDDFPFVVLVATLLTAEASAQIFWSCEDGEFAFFDTKYPILPTNENYMAIFNLFKNNLLERILIEELQSSNLSIYGLDSLLEAIKVSRIGVDFCSTGSKPSYCEARRLYGIVNEAGNLLVGYIFQALIHINENLFGARVNGLWYFIDCRGRIVSDSIVSELCLFKETIAPFRVGRLWGYIDENLNILVSPKYGGVNHFHEGYGVVERDGLFGYVDREGVEVVAPKYLSATNVCDGFIEISAQSKPQGVRVPISLVISFEGL